MTTTKRVLCEQRLRHIPAQFSWIDQRLVFEGHLARCDAHAAALYLFLLTVADAQGLSYWGDARVMRTLSTTNARLAHAREDLLHLGLIAYERPLYQVLALDGVAAPSEDLKINLSVLVGEPLCHGLLMFAQHAHAEVRRGRNRARNRGRVTDTHEHERRYKAQ